MNVSVSERTRARACVCVCNCLMPSDLVCAANNNNFHGKGFYSIVIVEPYAVSHNGLYLELTYGVPPLDQPAGKDNSLSNNFAESTHTMMGRVGPCALPQRNEDDGKQLNK